MQYSITIITITIYCLRQAVLVIYLFSYSVSKSSLRFPPICCGSGSAGIEELFPLTGGCSEGLDAFRIFPVLATAIILIVL